MSISVQTAERLQDFKILLRRDRKEVEVTHMFDAHESETFDPTEAVEVFVGDAMLTLTRGDALVFLFE